MRLLTVSRRRSTSRLVARNQESKSRIGTTAMVASNAHRSTKAGTEVPATLLTVEIHRYPR